VYACFNTSGAVSMSASNTCLLPGGGRLATINTAGVTGPTGATGVAGPTGATGVTGPAGAMVTEYHAFGDLGAATLASSHGVSITATCNVYDPNPAWVYFNNYSGATVYIAGGPFATGAAVVDDSNSGQLGFSGQAQLQAAGANGGVAANVTAWYGAGVCQFLSTH
jgi:hypothetical protein